MRRVRVARAARGVIPLALSVLALGTLTLTPRAQAQSASQRAAGLKAEADRAFMEEDFEKALALLEEAFELDPQPGYIANQGVILEKLADYAGAVDAFERFLATEPPADKARLAEQMLARLRPEVTVDSEPLGCTVKDESRGITLGRTPLRRTLVIGRYDLLLEKPGYEPTRIRLEVVPERGARGRGLLRAIEAPVAGPPAEPARSATETRQPVEPVPDSGGLDRRTWGFITLGAGALVTAAGATMLVMAHGAADDRDGARRAADWDDHQASAESLTTGSLIALGVGGAAVAAGLYLVLVDDGGSAGAAGAFAGGKRAPAPTGGATLSLWPGGLSLDARF